MALNGITAPLFRRARMVPVQLPSIRHYATQDTADLEISSFKPDVTPAAGTTAPPPTAFDPAARARARNRRLPPSRYQYRPPRYARGPLHPHQPPPPSSPVSREFVPGPFSLPRLQQTYTDTLAADYMCMTYSHAPPGTIPHVKSERLRTWQGDSPYYKNRPLRGPRGSEVLRLLRKPVTFRNIPQLTGITVHSMVKGAIENSSHLHVAGMVLQAITGVRAVSHKTRHNVAGFGIRENQYLSVTCHLEREDMYDFIGKLVDVVMPRIKDWRGVKGSSGDGSGNIAFGMRGEDVALFPEVEVNYDMYPPKMIPGCHIMIHTTASTDRDARVLLTQCGIPFYGKLIN